MNEKQQKEEISELDTIGQRITDLIQYSRELGWNVNINDVGTLEDIVQELQMIKLSLLFPDEMKNLLKGELKAFTKIYKEDYEIGCDCGRAYRKQSSK